MNNFIVNGAYAIKNRKSEVFIYTNEKYHTIRLLSLSPGQVFQIWPEV